jgi:hypothetical protein
MCKNKLPACIILFNNKSAIPFAVHRLPCLQLIKYWETFLPEAKAIA